jgi:acyl-CoA thioesterase YciA
MASNADRTQSQGLPTDQPTLALRVVMMPKDTNHYNTIFGGVILSYIDQAAFVQALRHAQRKWLTVAVDRVEFKAPVFSGDAVSFLARTVRTGTTSVTVEIDVQAERFDTGQRVAVTAARLVMVCVDHANRPVPFTQGPTDAH